MLRMNVSHLQLRSKVSLAHVNVAALNFYNNRFKLHTKDFSIIVCLAAEGATRALDETVVGLSTNSWPSWPARRDRWVKLFCD